MNSIILSIFFSPLLLSIFCLVFRLKNTHFIISLFGIIYLILSSLFLLPKLIFSSKMEFDQGINGLSMGMEYLLYPFNLITFLLILIIFFTIIVFYKDIIASELKFGLEKYFHSIIFLQLFSIIGILFTNSILNLYLFIEIFTITSVSLIGGKKDVKSFAISIDYFIYSAIGSLLLLSSCVLLFVKFDNANLTQIATKIQDIKYEEFGLISLILFMMLFGVILKFFLFGVHFSKTKSRILFSNVMSISTIFIKSIIGFYLLIKILLFIFGSELSFNILNLDKLLIVISFLVSFYGGYFMYKSDNLKINILYLLISNIGLILGLISIGIMSMKTILYLIVLNNIIYFLLFMVMISIFLEFENSSVKLLKTAIKNSNVIKISVILVILNLISSPFTIGFISRYNYIDVILGSEHGLFKVIFILNIVINFVFNAFFAIKIFYYGFICEDLADRIFSLGIWQMIAFSFVVSLGIIFGFIGQNLIIIS